jgi:UDP-3-O-[3-hydroxymyristoyl] glucosamine N-acyltransferase
MPTLADIAEALKVPLPENFQGDGGRRLTGMAGLEEAGPDEVSFISSNVLLREFVSTRAGVVIAARKVKLPEKCPRPVFVVDDADLAVAKVLALFAPPIPRPPVGIDPGARVASSARVAATAAIGPFVFIGERTAIGERCIVHAGAYIGDDVSLGDDCEIFPNVVIRERITIGHRVIIHAGSVIGSDGFGFVWNGTGFTKIPQIGRVVIEDDVEIGSCSCVDRAKFSETRIGKGSKVDNLVQLAHNVKIGPHCVIAAQTGIAGSSEIGAGSMLGGQCAVRDHITLGSRVMVAACSGVAEDYGSNSIVSGTPALPHRQSLREQKAIRRLPALVEKVNKLQEEIEELKQRLGEGNKAEGRRQKAE